MFDCLHLLRLHTLNLEDGLLRLLSASGLDRDSAPEYLLHLLLLYPLMVRLAGDGLGLLLLMLMLRLTGDGLGLLLLMLVWLLLLMRLLLMLL